MINNYTVSVCNEMINLIESTSYNIIVNHQRFWKFTKQIFEKQNFLVMIILNF